MASVTMFGVFGYTPFMAGGKIIGNRSMSSCQSKNLAGCSKPFDQIDINTVVFVGMVESTIIIG